MADTSGMVRVRLTSRALTALAALVWSGHLPRPLQQLLFDTADSLALPVSGESAVVLPLTTA